MRTPRARWGGIGFVLPLLTLLVVPSRALFIPDYGPEPHEYDEWRTWDLLKRRQFLETWCAHLNRARPIAQEVRVVLEPRSESLAYYTYRESRVIIGRTPLAAARKVFPDDRSGRQEFEAFATWVLLHEAGHAWVHQLKIPELGSSEELADEFAAVFAIEHGVDPEVLFKALSTMMATWGAAPEGETEALDDWYSRSAHHSFSMRAAVQSRLLSAPRWLNAPDSGGAPVEREKAVEQWTEAVSYWRKALADAHARPEGPETLHSDLSVHYKRAPPELRSVEKKLRASKFLERALPRIHDRFAGMKLELVASACGPMPTWMPRTLYVPGERPLLVLCYEDLAGTRPETFDLIPAPGIAGAPQPPAVEKARAVFLFEFFLGFAEAVKARASVPLGTRNGSAAMQFAAAQLADRPDAGVRAILAWADHQRSLAPHWSPDPMRRFDRVSFRRRTYFAECLAYGAAPSDPAVEGRLSERERDDCLLWYDDGRAAWKTAAWWSLTEDAPSPWFSDPLPSRPTR